MPRVKQVPNVAPTKAFEAASQQIGQSGVVLLPSEGAAELIKDEIKVVDGPGAMAHAEELAFMEEYVTVTVQEMPDNVEPLVPIHVNGKTQLFPRGQPIAVRRKYVEGLARAKPVGYRAEEFMDSTGGQAYRYNKTTGLRYPFTTDGDTPKGRDWLKKILAEGN